MTPGRLGGAPRDGRRVPFRADSRADSLLLREQASHEANYACVVSEGEKHAPLNNWGAAGFEI